MGRSFWILDNVTPLHQLGESVVKASYHLYPPRDAYRMHFRSRSFRGSARVPEYLQPGVMIDYYFSEKPDDVVMLEIRDGNGDLVRSFESKRKEIQLKRVGGPLIPTSPGMHRFFWDMGHAGSWTHTERFRVLVDPRVLEDGVVQTDLVA